MQFHEKHWGQCPTGTAPNVRIKIHIVNLLLKVRPKTAEWNWGVFMQESDSKLETLAYRISPNFVSIHFLYLFCVF